MTVATDLLRYAWRDYTTVGVPASGAHEPIKAEIRSGFDALAIELGTAANSMISFGTVALMEADTSQEDGTLAYVYRNNDDTADAANGVYQWNDTKSEWEAADWYFDTIKSSILVGIDVTGGNVKLGTSALNAYAGSDAIGIGGNALLQATGVNNIGIGASAGSQITTGIGNILIGWGAGSSGLQSATASLSIVIGYNAYSTGSGQIVLGTTDQDDFRLFGVSMARYDHARFNLVLGTINPVSVVSQMTGNVNLGVGLDVFRVATTAASNCAFGHYAMELIDTGRNNVAVGNTAGQNWAAVFDSVAIGGLAGRTATSGVGMAAVGFRSQQFATVARNNTSIGDSALWRSQGSRAVVAGYIAAEYMGAGDDCIVIGAAAGRNRDGGNRLILIGTSAGGFQGTTPTVNDTTGVVTGLASGGDRVIGIGYQAFEAATGSDLVGLGDQVGLSVTGGSQSIFIGNGAGNNGSQKVDPVNQIVIGHGAYAGNDNEVVIGNASNDSFTFGATTFSEAELQALKALAA